MQKNAIRAHLHQKWIDLRQTKTEIITSDVAQIIIQSLLIRYTNVLYPDHKRLDYLGENTSETDVWTEKHTTA